MSTLLRPPGLNGHLPDEVFFDQRLSSAAIWLLEYLVRAPRHWEIRRTDLYNRSPDGQYTVRRAVKELEDAGYLVIDQKRVNGHFTDSTWQLVIPGFEPAKRSAQPEESPNPQPDEADVENPAEESRVLATNIREEARQDAGSDRVLIHRMRATNTTRTTSRRADVVLDGELVGGGGAAPGSQRAAPPTEDGNAQLPIVGPGLSLQVEAGGAADEPDEPVPDRVKARRPEVAALVEAVRRGHREARAVGDGVRGRRP